MSVSVNVSAGQISRAFRLQPGINGNQTSILCTTGGSFAGNYTVEICNDPTYSTPTYWNPHDVLVSQTASASSNMAYPVEWVRLNCTNVSGGTVTMAVSNGGDIQ